MPSGQRDSQKEQIRTDGESVPHPIKDTWNKDVSFFLDNQTLRTNPFGQNLSGENIYRRCERITAAAHLVTAHILMDEPIRDRVRSTSIELLGDALSLRSELRASLSENVKRTRATSRKLISLVKVLGVSGYVSMANAEVLIEAIDEVGALLASAQRSVLAEELPLTKEDLTPRRPEVTRAPVQQKRTPRRMRSNTSATPSRADIKDSDNRRSDLSLGEAQLGMRSERILDILRAGGEVGIKDITSNLPEYSEKMVQRELASLVQRGVVKKTGAKRWSRYAIIT